MRQLDRENGEFTPAVHQCLCRSVGAGIPYQIGGDLYLLQPMRLKDWGVVEQHLLLQRKQAVTLDELPSDILELLQDETKVCKSVDLPDLFLYVATEEGAALRLWLSLRQKVAYHVCDGMIRERILQRTFEDLVKIHNQADGIDLLASLDWPKDPWAAFRSVIEERPNKDPLVDWKLVVRVLAENYGLSPDTIAELTVYQAGILQWSIDQLQGNFKLTKEQQESIAIARKAMKEHQKKTELGCQIG